MKLKKVCCNTLLTLATVAHVPDDPMDIFQWIEDPPELSLAKLKGSSSASAAMAVMTVGNPITQAEVQVQRSPRIALAEERPKAGKSG